MWNSACIVRPTMTNGREGEDRKEMVSIREDDEKAFERWDAITVRLRRIPVAKEDRAADCATPARRWE
jgi:hypothetical protein